MIKAILRAWRNRNRPDLSVPAHSYSVLFLSSTGPQDTRIKRIDFKDREEYERALEAVLISAGMEVFYGDEELRRKTEAMRNPDLARNRDEPYTGTWPTLTMDDVAKAFKEVNDAHERRRDTDLPRSGEVPEN